MSPNISYIITQNLFMRLYYTTYSHSYVNCERIEKENNFNNSYTVKIGGIRIQMQFTKECMDVF